MLLNLLSLSKTYQSDGRSIEALKEVSLELDAGQFCSL